MQNVTLMSDTHLLTCSIEVIHSIECNNDICIVHPSIMADPVLLEGPGVGYSNLHMPHAGDGIQDHFVHPPTSLAEAATSNTACKTEVGSNLCLNPQLPQCCRGTSRPGTYS